MFFKVLIFSLFLITLSKADNSPLGQSMSAEEQLVAQPLTGQLKHWDDLLLNVNKTLNSLEIILFNNEVSNSDRIIKTFDSLLLNLLFRSHRVVFVGNGCLFSVIVSLSKY